MHSVLHLESNRPDSQADQSLEKTLVQPCFGSLFAHDNGTELAVVAHQDYVLGALQDRNESLGLSSLGGLIDKDLLEFEMLQSLVKSADASSTNDIGVSQNFIFCLSLQIFVDFIVLLIQFAVDFSLLNKLLHSLERPVFQVLYLLVKGNVIDI